MLNEKDNKFARYKEYEAGYLGNMSDNILKDDGFSDLEKQMKKMYQELIQQQIEQGIREEHGAEMLLSVTRLKAHMHNRLANMRATHANFNQAEGSNMNVSTPKNSSSPANRNNSSQQRRGTVSPQGKPQFAPLGGESAQNLSGEL